MDACGLSNATEDQDQGDVLDLDDEEDYFELAEVDTCAPEEVSENEIRLRRTLATDAACAWVLFIGWVVKHEAERKNALLRAELHEQQACEREICERKYACDLQWVDPHNLKRYCNFWDVPYAPNTLVHIGNRRSMLEDMISPSGKWLRPPEGDEECEVDLRPAYVKVFKETLGFDFRIFYQQPSIYCTQMLVAHVHLYNVQCAAGGFHPEFTVYAFQYFFHRRPEMKQEAAAFLRTLSLLAKKHGVNISDSSQAFSSLILKALLTCMPVTLKDIQQELQNSTMAKRALGCV